MANDVTIGASTALANSTTPRHWARVSTPLKPAGGVAGGAIGIGEPGAVGPGAADPQIGRRQRRGEFSQPRVAEIDRRPIGEQIRPGAGVRPRGF